MASATELREAAAAAELSILEALADMAGKKSAAGAVRDMAEAYALVKSGMPAQSVAVRQPR